MHPLQPLPSLAGGALIGLGAALLLLCNGRVAGVSGILGGLFAPARDEVPWRLAFLTALVAGSLAMAAAIPSAFEAHLARSTAVLVTGGVLVGFGSRLGNGCTSGHGVCGISRLSPRAIAATLVFMATGAAAVFALGHWGGAR